MRSPKWAVLYHAVGHRKDENPTASITRSLKRVNPLLANNGQCYNMWWGILDGWVSVVETDKDTAAA
jgi:hypothetical protein